MRGDIKIQSNHDDSMYRLLDATRAPCGNYLNHNHNNYYRLRPPARQSDVWKALWCVKMKKGRTSSSSWRRKLKIQRLLRGPPFLVLLRGKSFEIIMIIQLFAVCFVHLTCVRRIAFVWSQFVVVCAVGFFKLIISPESDLSMQLWNAGVLILFAWKVLGLNWIALHLL